MLNFTDYNKNAQKDWTKGMESFLNWQKQAMENILSMVENVIEIYKKNLNKTNQQYQDWEKNMKQELNSKNA